MLYFLSVFRISQWIWGCSRPNRALGVFQVEIATAEREKIEQKLLTATGYELKGAEADLPRKIAAEESAVAKVAIADKEAKKAAKRAEVQGQVFISFRSG